MVALARQSFAVDSVTGDGVVRVIDRVITLRKDWKQQREPDAASLA